MSVSVPKLSMPPPSKGRLPLRVELATVTAPGCRCRRLRPAELPLRVELMTVTVPELLMPPPVKLAELPRRVELVTSPCPR